MNHDAHRYLIELRRRGLLREIYLDGMLFEIEDKQAGIWRQYRIVGRRALHIDPMFYLGMEPDLWAREARLVLSDPATQGCLYELMLRLYPELRSVGGNTQIDDVLDMFVATLNRDANNTLEA